jgi:DNA-binding MarR family transcriptional regulator
MSLSASPTPALDQRLRDGFERLSAALRMASWRVGETDGLTPSQMRILDLLVTRDTTGLRVTEIADELGVRQATASQSIGALLRKGCLAKVTDPADRRATRIILTKSGHAMRGAQQVERLAEWTGLSGLTPDERITLLRLVIKMIRSLQIAGAIPAQRLCVTCRYFRPYAHAGANAPHHCGLVDAAFGEAELRLDCPEHETAGGDQLAATWAGFQGGLR